MKTLTEFGKRLVTLHTGQQGLRGGLACTVREVAGDAPMMDFIASDNSVDRYNEVIEPDGWQLDNFRANPVIPDCHDYSSVLKILGRANSVQVNSDGQLVNRVEFCLDNPLGNIAWKMAKAGFIKSQSVGSIPVEWTNGGKGEPDRTYTACELLEISLVVVPANPGATVGLALKSGVLTQNDVRRAANLLKLCGQETADPEAQAGASGAGVHDAQLLKIARGVWAALNPGAFKVFCAGRILQ